MEQPITALYEFINAAHRSRNYTNDVASGLRSALRLFEKELNEEEIASIPLFKDRLMQIYRQVINKNISKFTAGSLDQYRKRMLRLLGDYEKYGVDPTKMASWSSRLKEPKKIKKVVGSHNEPNEIIQDSSQDQNSSVIAMTKHQLARSQGYAAIIQTAHDLTIDEANKIRAYIDYLLNTIESAK